MPEAGYKTMLVIGGVLAGLGLIGWFVSVLAFPAQHVLGFVNKKLVEKFTCVYALQADLPQLHTSTVNISVMMFRHWLS